MENQYRTKSSSLSQRNTKNLKLTNNAILAYNHQ